MSKICFDCKNYKSNGICQQFMAHPDGSFTECGYYKKRKKIYVITAGDYSDYQIYGVTTDPERAENMQQKLKAYFGSRETVNLEEYEDGVFENENIDSYIPTEYYRVEARTGSSDVFVTKYTDNCNRPMQTISLKGTSDWEMSPNGFPRREVFMRYIVKYIRANSEEQAIKIAIDEITKYRVQKGELGQ